MADVYGINLADTSFHFTCLITNKQQAHGMEDRAEATIKN